MRLIKISSIWVSLIFSVQICIGAESKQIDSHVYPETDYPYWGEYKQTKFEDVRQPEWDAQDSIKDGWDWTLPMSVKPNPKTYVTLYRTWAMDQIKKVSAMPKLSFPCEPVVEHWCYWRDIEKQEGVYDFKPLIDMIKEAALRGYGSVVRLHSGAVRFTPKWFEKYNVPIRKNEKYVGDGVVSYDVSHPEFHKRYLKLVEELGKTGIAHMKEVKGLYVGYASPSNGDEGIGPDGVDPDTVEHVIERLNAWAKITKGVEYKMYMGGWSNYGIKKGFGIRRGFVEMYLYHIPDNSIGQRIDKDGYLYVDEKNPVIKNGLRNGDENEEYETWWSKEKSRFRFGKTTNSFNYRYFTSILRLVQMRCNYVLWNEFTLNPDMFVWAGMELGRTAKDSPDAWCFLRESYLWESNMKRDNVDNPKGGLKNFERWVYQRDCQGYETKPAVKIYHAIKMWMVDKNRPYDFIARTGKKIGFTVDRNFLKGESQNICVKISYFDFGKGKFTLDYFDNGKKISKEIVCNDTQKLKTATFFITFDATDSKDKKFDFEIVGHNDYEPTISFFRVIKTDSK